MAIFDKQYHIFPHRGKLLLTLMSGASPTPAPPDESLWIDDAGNFVIDDASNDVSVI